jgi:hypothetical protein
VIHTRPLESKPCRVTIIAARSPSGVQTGNAARNVSSGVLTTYLRETGCGTPMVKAPVGGSDHLPLLVFVHFRMNGIDRGAG